jgi:hypothetical protein
MIAGQIGFSEDAGIVELGIALIGRERKSIW